MAGPKNPMISDFTQKPRTQALFEAIDDYVTGLGPVTTSRAAQVSYRGVRKFLWLWAYEQTGDGTLYLTVLLDHEVADDRVHSVTQVSANRFNHHVEVRSAATARSAWLHELLRSGYELGTRPAGGAR